MFIESIMSLILESSDMSDDLSAIQQSKIIAD